MLQKNKNKMPHKTKYTAGMSSGQRFEMYVGGCKQTNSEGGALLNVAIGGHVEIVRDQQQSLYVGGRLRALQGQEA